MEVTMSYIKLGKGERLRCGCCGRLFSNQIAFLDIPDEFCYEALCESCQDMPWMERECKLRHAAGKTELEQGEK
jgi:hypothetical protein